MKAVSCNQRNGGHRKALCPGAPQGPAWYQEMVQSTSGQEFWSLDWEFPRFATGILCH